MDLVSINIGASEPIAAKSGQSGINKRAVPQAQVTASGLQGDKIVDVKHHGGIDQAVYVYTRADYTWWEAELGRALPSGTFGENLTLDAWPADQMCVGDHLQVGTVVMEVTSPRIPCVTLEAHIGLRGFTKTFLRARRPGVYLRVLTTGDIAMGDPVRMIPDQRRKRILDWPGLFGADLTTRADVEDWLAVPVHHKMRADLAAMLDRMPQ